MMEWVPSGILQIELFNSSMEKMALIQPEAVEGSHLMYRWYSMMHWEGEN